MNRRGFFAALAAAACARAAPPADVAAVVESTLAGPLPAPGLIPERSAGEFLLKVDASALRPFLDEFRREVIQMIAAHEADIREGFEPDDWRGFARN